MRMRAAGASRRQRQGSETCVRIMAPAAKQAQGPRSVPLHTLQMVDCLFSVCVCVCAHGCVTVTNTKIKHL